MKYDPFGAFREEALKLLKTALEEKYPEVKDRIELGFDIPPPGHGDLAFRCFEITRLLKIPPQHIAEKLSACIERLPRVYVERVVAEGGYLNFHANITKLGELVANTMRVLQEKYGFNPTTNPRRIIVEFLSANPVHPIHLGSARNAILGDALARLLEWRGHKVRRHFYVNDMGRQVAIAALGYSLLGIPKPWEKPDHVIGFIYASTCSLLEIRRLKRLLEEAKALGKDQLYRERLRELDEWVRVVAELREKNPQVMDRLMDLIDKLQDPEREIASIRQRYESKGPGVVKLVRTVCELVLAGFKETLDKARISFDSFDWESEITAWSGRVQQVLRRLEATPYVIFSRGTMVFLADEVANVYGLREEFKIPENYEVPPLTLIRSDGTTLYTTRDIAYTLWKFEHADQVINVIGIEQRVAQLQLKLALVALGHLDLARNLIHFGYELVKIPGYRMSSRRGRYITFDELMNEAIKRARFEVEHRSPGLPPEAKEQISEVVGIGAIKYAFLSVSPLKPVTFEWSRVLSFERNSAPFIQYAHARAHNILARAKVKPTELKGDPSLLKDPSEKDLLIRIAKFPTVVAEAADRLRPDMIAEYVNNLALAFNSFYDKVPVIHAETPELKEARLWLVNAVRIVIKNALEILGIIAPTRM